MVVPLTVINFTVMKLISLVIASVAIPCTSRFLRPQNKGADNEWAVTQQDLDEAKDVIRKDAELKSTELRKLWKGSKEVNGAKLATLFYNTYRYSADHSYALFDEDSTVFVSTGDIPQMWLRDSTFQLQTYLPLAVKSKPGSAIRRVIESAMARQRRFILDDPYGSAFYARHGNTQKEGPNKFECPKSDTCPQCYCTRCAPKCGMYTYQKDYELDSLLFPLLLHYNYWKETGTTKHLNRELVDVMRAAMTVMKVEQNHFKESKYYYKPFGHKMKDGIGLVWSFALPSDDQAGGFYNIPENIMAASVLEKVAEMAVGPLNEKQLGKDILALSAQIDKAVNKYGVVKDSQGKDIYAFSVDGLGSNETWDDANLPNLLWLPYLYRGRDAHFNSEVYNNTRNFVLSDKNRNFFGNMEMNGLGSQHRTTGLTRHGNTCNGDCIWHLGLAIQGMTTEDRKEKVRIMEEILSSDADKGLLHEGFEARQPKHYNRDEFGWADSVFAEWVLREWTNGGALS
jgi:hypothetical protein